MDCDIVVPAAVKAQGWVESRAKENRQRPTGKSVSKDEAKGGPRCAGQRETGSGDERENLQRARNRCQKENCQLALSKGKLAKGMEQMPKGKLPMATQREWETSQGPGTDVEREAANCT